MVNHFPYGSDNIDLKIWAFIFFSSILGLFSSILASNFSFIIIASCLFISISILIFRIFKRIVKGEQCEGF